MQNDKYERSSCSVKILDLQAEAFSSATANPSIGTVVGAGAPPVVGLQNLPVVTAIFKKAGESRGKNQTYTYSPIITLKES